MNRKSPGRPAEVDDLSKVTLLSEPNRRALYEYISSKNEWVSREEAANAVGLQKGIASHHLDRLANEGLLEIEFKTRSGRSGPGAGRPAKMYRRSRDEVEVNFPPREYRLAATLLADAVDQSLRDGVSLQSALESAAKKEGKRIGEIAKSKSGGDQEVHQLIINELRQLGYEPNTLDDGVTVLHNCPFHSLAEEHRELICTMNNCMLGSMLEQIEDAQLRVKLEPEEGHCCVKLLPESA